MSFLIGTNVTVANKGLLAAIEETVKIHGNCFIIHIRSNRLAARVKALKDFHVDEATLVMRKHGIEKAHTFVHASHFINLAGRIEVRKRGINDLKNEIARTDELGIPYLILHPGAHIGQGNEMAMYKIVDSLNKILSYNQTCMVLLEMMAGNGTKVGGTIEEMGEIIKRVEVKSRLGVAIHTAHLWAMGYDIVNNFDEFLEAFDDEVGLEKLKLVHISGSQFPRGSRKDKHANIGAEDDTIGKEALRTIFQHPKLVNIPKILETPYGQHEKEIDYLKGDDDVVLSRFSFY